MWGDLWLVAAKDLRVELRSRVLVNQLLPFAFLVLLLFAFALDPDSGVLARATAGLFWVAVLFCALLAVQRAFTLEAADGSTFTFDAPEGTELPPNGFDKGEEGYIDGGDGDLSPTVDQQARPGRHEQVEGNQTVPAPSMGAQGQARPRQSKLRALEHQSARLDLALERSA